MYTDFRICRAESGLADFGVLECGYGGVERSGHLLGGRLCVVREVRAAGQGMAVLPVRGGLLGTVRGVGWLRRVVCMVYDKRLNLSVQPFLLGKDDAVVGQVHGNLFLIFEGAVEELLGDFVLYLRNDGAL